MTVAHIHLVQEQKMVLAFQILYKMSQFVQGTTTDMLIFIGSNDNKAVITYLESTPNGFPMRRPCGEVLREVCGDLALLKSAHD